VDTAVAAMGRVTPATYRAALTCLVGFDRRARLGELRAPCLLVAGARDPVAPPDMMRRMAARIPGARFVEIEGAGHLANLERPRAFNAALARFFTDISTPDADAADDLRPDRETARPD